MSYCCRNKGNVHFVNTLGVVLVYEDGYGTSCQGHGPLGWTRRSLYSSPVDPETPLFPGPPLLQSCPPNSLSVGLTQHTFLSHLPYRHQHRTTHTIQLRRIIDPP
jgi:hypothetical protein